MRNSESHNRVRVSSGYYRFIYGLKKSVFQSLRSFRRKYYEVGIKKTKIGSPYLIAAYIVLTCNSFLCQSYSPCTKDLAMAREQLGVLSALDSAKTQWYHFTAIIIAGMGFFTDAYDLFCIPNVTKLLGRIYYTHPNSTKPGTLPPNVSAAVNGVALCGTLAGQLFFGWLGDKMGRKKVYGLTLALMVFSSLASGLSFGHSAKGTIATLCFFRFWLGFGIGGDYPLSATIMSEYANKKTRGAFIASVFAMQGFGILAGGIVSLVVSTAFDHAYSAPAYKVDHAASLVPEADYVWRIILMFGAVPAGLTYYWRMKMPETARYTLFSIDKCY